ncbi:PQQ-binding-like beta-propeller repeat protein [Streptomyces sp. NPDC017993]|uniref:outer membrane protein assembly factor BamB family protein n=1 Tax=Streptomyces sp. NPDC017993 TaxID=3365027 RepID=UPI0037959EBC
MPAILGIVMVLLIATGVGGYFLLMSDDSETPTEQRPANAMTRLWKTPSPTTEEPSLGKNGLRSMWFNDDDVIFGDPQGVRAYNRASGKKKWTVKTPKGAGEVCGMSKEASDEGVGAVIFDAGGDDCSYLSVVDTDSGRTLWSKNFSAGDEAETSPQVVVNSKVVAVAMGRGYAGFTIAGGAKVWELTARGHDCTTTVALSPQYRAVGSDCYDAKPKTQLDLQHLEYSTIHSKVPGESRAAGDILSDRPLTMRMSSDANVIDSDSSLSTFTDDGDLDKTFKLEGELKDLRLEPRSTYVDEEEEVLVSSYGTSDGLAALDLKTGKLLWKKRGSAGIAGVDNEGLIVLTDSPEGAAPGADTALVAINVRDGKEKVMGTLYDPKQDLSSVGLLSVAWNGKVNELYVQGEGVQDDRPSVQAFKLPNN